MIYIITGAFIILDFVTGIIKAFKGKSFTSSVMREGLYHKSGSIIVMLFGALVDYAQGYLNLGLSIPVATTICIYICLMEIGSIIENVGKINPRAIPNKLQKYFSKLAVEEKTEKEEDKLDSVHSKKG